MSDRQQMSATSAPILRTTGLTKSFGGLVAVSNVSLDLFVGEIHVVIGPNGAGKTTLTNLLSGDLSEQWQREIKTQVLDFGGGGFDA